MRRKRPSKSHAISEPDLRQLRQVLAIMEYGSLNKAATALRISQPTLSRSIARLEDQLGVQLFERTSQSTTPTVFGRQLAERSARVIREVGSVGRWIQLMGEGGAGAIRVGIGAVAQSVLLPDALSRLVKRFPRLRVDIVIDMPPTLYDRLRGRDIDIAIGGVSEAADHRELSVSPLFQSEYVTVARAGHPAAEAGAFDEETRDRYRFAFSPLPPELLAEKNSDVLDRILSNAVISTSYEVIHALVEHNDFVSTGPLVCYQKALASGRFARIERPSAGVFSCVVAVRTDVRDSPLMTEVRRIFLDAAGDLAGLC
jgi:DNA-binding transcriptional LysR family regulator